MTEVIASSTQGTIAKTPRPLVAALLSAIWPPLGQIYAGSLRRGLLVWLCCFTASFGCLALLASPLQAGAFGLVAAVLFGIAIYVATIADAFFLARRCEAAVSQRLPPWLLYPLAVILFSLLTQGMAVAFREYIAESYVTPSRSMFPAIVRGDRFYVDKFWKTPQSVSRDDVILFHPQGPGSAPWAFRVVGLPGDQIEVAGGCVSVNGTPEAHTLIGLPGDSVEFTGNEFVVNGSSRETTHALIDARIHSSPQLATYGPMIVPEGHWFVLGDNRRLSKDSRIIGPIPFENYVGTVRMLLWSSGSRSFNSRDPDADAPEEIFWGRFGQKP